MCRNGFRRGLLRQWGISREEFAGCDAAPCGIKDFFDCRQMFCGMDTLARESET
jgi:hypothetical protein